MTLLAVLCSCAAEGVGSCSDEHGHRTVQNGIGDSFTCSLERCNMMKLLQSPGL